MSKIKASIDFTRHLDPELCPSARTIHDQMSENAATFPAPPVSMATLVICAERLAARASRAKVEVIAFQVARRALEKALRGLGLYVNSVAKGEAMIVAKSGFPHFSTARPVNTSPLAAPQNLRLSHGKLSGVIKALYKPAKEKSVNEVQICTGDPNREEDWKQAGFYKHSRAELSGLTPGTLIWVRVRTVGQKGVMGAWSDPAQIRVL
jgi:hypothetical protein